MIANKASILRSQIKRPYTPIMHINRYTTVNMDKNHSYIILYKMAQAWQNGKNFKRKELNQNDFIHNKTINLNIVNSLIEDNHKLQTWNTYSWFGTFTYIDCDSDKHVFLRAKHSHILWRWCINITFISTNRKNESKIDYFIKTII